MAEKTLATKLRLRADGSLWSSDPERVEELIPLPEGTQRANDPTDATAAIVLADDAETLRRVLDVHGQALREPDLLWVAYPKGGRSDINRDTLWPYLAEYDLRPISQIALDDTWSALRFRPLKEGEQPFTGKR